MMACDEGHLASERSEAMLLTSRRRESGIGMEREMEMEEGGSGSKYLHSLQ